MRHIFLSLVKQECRLFWGWTYYKKQSSWIGNVDKLEGSYLSRLKTIKSLWTLSNLCCNWPFWRGAKCTTLVLDSDDNNDDAEHLIRNVSSFYPEDLDMIKLEDASFPCPVHSCILGPLRRVRTSCSSHVSLLSLLCRPNRCVPPQSPQEM